MRSFLAAALAVALLTTPVSAQTEPSVPPITINDCPFSYPVKGNRAGRQVERPVDPIYHVPGRRYYAATDPEECFATAADAEAAGYRAPPR